MGVDITCFVELRDKGKWHIAPVKVQSKYAEDKNEWYWAQPWTGRDSELFGILSDGYNNIDHPRGLPDDVTNEVKVERDRFFKYENGEKSADYAYNDTYFTLFELYLALGNKKKYPKYYKCKDAFSNPVKEKGPRESLKGFADSVANFANMCGWYDTKDVRVIMWFDG